MIWDKEEKKSGAAVDCLEPLSGFFDDECGDPEQYEFPETAYGDGDSLTTSEQMGYTIFATCGNEEHVD